MYVLVKVSISSPQDNDSVHIFQAPRDFFNRKDPQNHYSYTHNQIWIICCKFTASEMGEKSKLKGADWTAVHGYDYFICSH